jgi:hypothetical protein
MSTPRSMRGISEGQLIANAHEVEKKNDEFE